jgi:hypothetical protein
MHLPSSGTKAYNVFAAAALLVSSSEPGVLNALKATKHSACLMMFWYIFWQLKSNDAVINAMSPLKCRYWLRAILLRCQTC